MCRIGSIRRTAAASGTSWATLHAQPTRNLLHPESFWMTFHAPPVERLGTIFVDFHLQHSLSPIFLFPVLELIQVVLLNVLLFIGSTLEYVKSCEDYVHTYLRTHLQAIFGGQLQMNILQELVAIGMCNIEEFWSYCSLCFLFQVLYVMLMFLATVLSRH